VNRDWERMLASMRAFFGIAPQSSDGGRSVELPGVIAGVAPAVPERSLPNSVVYESEDALEAALDRLAALYDEAGIQAWTVWVPEYHERARELLSRAGHELDASPTAMIADLADAEPPRAGDPLPDARPTREEIGRVNDRAYGTGDAFQRLMGEGPADPDRTYVARLGGEAAATVLTHYHDGDCSVWWVATAPEARGRGLASGLMRRALAEARRRGCDVSTLQATTLGRPVYERLGYRSLGTIEMWERRRR
jgi:ribosomal protein S18 acetylase RimI-like enzyme